MDIFYIPIWWDLLTFMSVASLGLLISSTLVAGYFASPWIFEWFDQATAGYVAWMVETFDRMFMTVSARACVLAILGCMCLFASVGFYITSGLPEGGAYAFLRFMICSFLAFGPFKIPLGANLPRFVVKKMWERRVALFEDQLLDALTFLSNGLESGLSIIQSMEMVKEELPPPVSQEFALVLSEQRLGITLEDALLDLEARIDTEDVQILVTSINILRQSGGNLAETFDTIAHTIRERKKVQGKIRSLTAQGVSQGVIIVCMPFVLAGALYLIDPTLISRLWTTGLGWVFIGIMLFLQTCGALMIRKIVTIDV